MQTASKVVTSSDSAIGLIFKLARKSQWFQFEPLPDDRYEITVKAEIAHLLDQPINVKVAITDATNTLYRN